MRLFAWRATRENKLLEADGAIVVVETLCRDV
jgi:hypothetical protein